MASSSLVERVGVWLLLVAGAVLVSSCGDDEARVVYDQRIRGQVLRVTSDDKEIDVEAETYAEEDTQVLVRTTTDDDGHFELFVPDGEYRVSAHVNEWVYYGSGQARPLRAQATPVSAGRGLESPDLLISLGNAEIELHLPSNGSDWYVETFLLNPVLLSRIAYGRSEISSEDSSVVRTSFVDIAPDEYLVELRLSSRSSDASDRGTVPLEIDGRTSSTITVQGAERTDARVVIDRATRVRGVFEGPSSASAGAVLQVVLWDPADEDFWVKYSSFPLDESPEFEVELFLERDLLLQWSVALPGDDNDETARWLGGWNRRNAVPVRPSADPEPIRLEAVGLRIDFARPPGPGFYAGWLEVMDEEGTVRGSYFVSDSNEYQGPIFFSNLPAGSYYLHYRGNTNSPILDQWYGDGLTMSFDQARPIDALETGTTAEEEWTPHLGGNIFGRALDESGSPVANHWVVFAIGDSPIFENGVKTDENGEFQLAGLLNGRYRVGVVRSGTSRVTWYPRTSVIAEAEYIEIADYGTEEGYEIQLLPLGEPADAHAGK